MTPLELFALPPAETSNDLRCLRGASFDFLHELGPQFIASSPRVSVDVIHHHQFDRHTFWRLMRLTLDAQPVMILQNSTRGPSPFARRFIVDHPRFSLLLAHLNFSGMGAAAADTVAGQALADVVPVGVDLPVLTSFAGHVWSEGELTELPDLEQRSGRGVRAHG